MADTLAAYTAFCAASPDNPSPVRLRRVQRRSARNWFACWCSKQHTRCGLAPQPWIAPITIAGWASPLLDRAAQQLAAYGPANARVQQLTGASSPVPGASGPPPLARAAKPPQQVDVYSLPRPTPWDVAPDADAWVVSALRVGEGMLRGYGTSLAWAAQSEPALGYYGISQSWRNIASG